MSLDAARAVADAVLYEGYLLYPYRASSSKNRSRWQFGVLGPPRASAGAFAEPPSMRMQCLVRPGALDAVRIHVRFLQVQVRAVQRLIDGSYVDVESLTADGVTWLSWDEAVEHEIARGLGDSVVTVPGGEEIEDIAGGRVVRRRQPLTARLRASVSPDGDLARLTVEVTNEHPAPVSGKAEAAAASLIGTHVLIEGEFVSVVDPPPSAVAAAARCVQDRCWPVLADSDRVLLGAPIILYDHPRIAAQSPGALYDSTEIDEILSLRVMTMTDAEKAEARATDPRAAGIVDRVDAMTPDDFAQLHGGASSDAGWWDRAAEPGADTVLIEGVRVTTGSLVRVHPRRRADAQDLFFADQVARVTAVVSDVDDETHVAVVLVDDPAADLHDWYGRYLYFAPDELEPLEGNRS